jgi:leucine dehydrogenase
MAYVHEATAHVAGLADRSGDPSPVTARGVLRAIQAAARQRWGSDDLRGRTVALQGAGNVGSHLAQQLAAAGARLLVADVDPWRVRNLVEVIGAAVVEPDEIYDAEAELFAPCALGGILNDESIARLRAEVVAGAANNQLLEPRHGFALEARGILYAPDYVANAGGVINGCRELLGWDAERARRQVDAIYDTMLDVFRVARERGLPPHAAADRIAEERLMRGATANRRPVL